MNEQTFRGFLISWMEHGSAEIAKLNPPRKFHGTSCRYRDKFVTLCECACLCVLSCCFHGCIGTLLNKAKLDAVNSKSAS